MKKLYKILFTLVILATSGNLLAQYSAADTMVINTIKTTNFTGTTTLNWTDPDPGNWIGVVWDTLVTPYRITELHIADMDANRGGTGHDSTEPAGIWCGSIAPLVYPTSDVNALHWMPSGVETDLSGVLDLTGLSELRILVLNRNINVTEVKVSGLQKLEYLYVGNTGISDLDASGLPALLQIKIPMNRYANKAGKPSPLKSIDASDCPNLVRLKASWNIDSLESVDVSNCTSLLKLSIKESNALTNLNMSGVTSLYKMSVGNGSGQLTSVPSDVANNTNLRALGLASQMFAGTLDLTPFDSLRKVGFSNNSFEDVSGAFGLTILERLAGTNNNLDLTTAVQLANNTTAGTGNNFATQNNDGFTMIYTDSIDYGIHDSIMVDTVLTGSTFNLYTAAGVLDSTNTTGIFTFTLADTGLYYVEMINSGIIVTTDTIEVLAAAALISTNINSNNFGSVQIGSTATQTMTVSNVGNLDLNVSNITTPTGFSLSSTTATIAAGGSSNITVTFTPTAAQMYSGQIAVISNAANDYDDKVNVTGVGIEVIGGVEETDNTLSFYPNPTKDILFIKDNTGNIQVLNLYSIEGTLVETVKLTSNTTQIDFSQLNRGIYIIRSVDGKINQKVVKH